MTRTSGVTRIVTAAALSIGLLAALGGVALAQAKAPKFKIAIATSGDALHWYPAYVARAAGFFAEEGLEVDWVDVGSGTKQVAAVVSGGSALTPLGLQTAFQAAAGGADIVAVSALFDRFALQLVLSNAALAKSGINPGMTTDEIAPRLKGMRIAITGVGSSTDALLRSILAARGMEPDSTVRIQPLGSPPAIQAAFEKDMIDGYILSAPFPELVELRNLGKIVINPLNGGVAELDNVPYSAMMTTRKLINEQPEMIGAAVRALTRAMLFTQQNPKESQAMVKKLFPKLDPEIFAKAEPGYQAASSRTPVITRDQFDRMIAWMKLTSKEANALKFEQVVDNRFAEPAAASILQKK
jgi:NitT/TauT family transport system substrate-binding protein